MGVPSIKNIIIFLIGFSSGFLTPQLLFKFVASLLESGLLADKLSIYADRFNLEGGKMYIEDILLMMSMISLFIILIVKFVVYLKVFGFGFIAGMFVRFIVFGFLGVDVPFNNVLTKDMVNQTVTNSTL